MSTLGKTDLLARADTLQDAPIQTLEMNTPGNEENTDFAEYSPERFAGRFLMQLREGHIGNDAAWAFDHKAQ